MRLLQHDEKTEPASLHTQTEESSPTEEVMQQTTPIARLQMAIARRKKNVSFANNSAWATLGALLLTIPLVCYFTVFATARSMGVELFSGIAIWASSYFVGSAVSLSHTWRGKKELERALTDLTGVTDLSAIVPLIDVVAFYGPYNSFNTLGSDYRAYQAAVQELTPLLSRAVAEDTSVVSLQQLHQLPRVLKHVANPRNSRRYHVPFAMAILSVLEELGDSAAIPVLSRLAKIVPYDEEQRQLREAAEKCLSRLQERQQEVDQQMSLLRASSSIPIDNLLRAAAETSTTDPMQLLRPGQRDQ